MVDGAVAGEAVDGEEEGEDENGVVSARSHSPCLQITLLGVFSVHLTDQSTSP